MPRSNRPRNQGRGRSGGKRDGEYEELDTSKLFGGRSTESRRGGQWTVQQISAAAATKEYRCPGCGQAIASGTAHVVAWRNDGVLGDAADLDNRRHWHQHCWRIGGAR